MKTSKVVILAIIAATNNVACSLIPSLPDPRVEIQQRAFLAEAQLVEDRSNIEKSTSFLDCRNGSVNPEIVNKCLKKWHPEDWAKWQKVDDDTVRVVISHEIVDSKK